MVGRLLYNNDNKASFDIDDELLVSLELAISNKLRRSEPFMLTVAIEGMGAPKLIDRTLGAHHAVHVRAARETQP